MKFFLGTCVVAISAYVSAGGGSLLAQTLPRTIPFDMNVPIAQRLNATDRDVVVVKATLPPMLIEPNESFEEETGRLGLAEGIAVVRVSTVQGELTKPGTWIRTKVNVEVSQAVKSSSGRPLGHSIELCLDGGTTQLGAVTVTAGVFTRFVPQEQYLVFLTNDPTCNSLFPAPTFHINDRGTLERARNSQGSEEGFKTTLVGRKLTEVTKALSRAK